MKHEMSKSISSSFCIVAGVAITFAVLTTVDTPVRQAVLGLTDSLSLPFTSQKLIDAATIRGQPIEYWLSRNQPINAHTLNGQSGLHYLDAGNLTGVISPNLFSAYESLIAENKLPIGSQLVTANELETIKSELNRVTSLRQDQRVVVTAEIQSIEAGIGLAGGGNRGAIRLDVVLGEGLVVRNGKITAVIGNNVDLITQVANVLNVVNGGTGLNKSPANGQFLIGKDGGYGFGALGAEDGVLLEVADGVYTYRLDGTVCRTSGNCSGAGDGVVGHGEAGQLAFFTATSNIASSSNITWQSATESFSVSGTINSRDGFRVNGQPLSTTHVVEGSGLYWTTQRFDTALGTKTTDHLAEGGFNLYFSNDRVSANLDVTANTASRHSAVTTANTATLDLTLVGQHLTGTVVQSGLRTSLLNNDAGFIANLADFSTDSLAEGQNNKYYSAQLFNLSLATKSTDDLAEGSVNLYWDLTRFNNALMSKSTDDLAEGASNLYFTTARLNNYWSTKSTTDLTEGVNLYYTTARFNTDLATKTTDSLTEGLINRYSQWTTGVNGIGFGGRVGIGTNNPLGLLHVAVPTSLFTSTQYSFESGNISPLTTSGDASWSTDSSSVNTGSFSARSGSILDSKSTTLTLTASVPDAAQISFARRVSSENNYDFLIFYIDGVEKARWSGSVNWGTVAYAIPVGSHTFAWTYIKDSGVSSGLDSAWVDDVTLAPPAPVGLIFTENGYLGIGTNAPTASLTIQGSSDSVVFGPELVTNGDFSTSAGWSFGAGWTHDSQNGEADTAAGGAGTLSSMTNIVSGEIYRLMYTVKNKTAGFVTVSAGGVTDASASFNDTYSFDFRATNFNSITFTPSVSFNGSIDNVSLRKINPSPAHIVLNGSDGAGALEIRSGGSGKNNTFVGLKSGQSNTTGSSNTALGSSALSSNLSGLSITAVGYSALNNNTASYNVALGAYALFANTTAESNTAVGALALYGNTTGMANTAVGREALRSNTTGYNNVALGDYALYSNLTGGGNTVVGHQAMRFGSGVTGNTVIGDGALYWSTASYNTAVGSSALQSNTTGSSNAALGSFALYSNTTGNQLSAFGRYTLYNSTIGDSNTAFGYGSLYGNTTGSRNTGLGAEVSYYNQTGNNGVYIGYQAGRGTANHNKSGNVFIGYQAGYNEIGSDLLYIANSNTATPLIKGDFAGSLLTVNGVLTATSGLTVSSLTTNGGILYTNTSGNVAQLTVGTAGQCLVSTGGVPSWGSCGSALPANNVTGSGASGQLAFWNGTNTQTGSANLTWQSASNSLWINHANGSIRVMDSANYLDTRVDKNGLAMADKFGDYMQVGNLGSGEYGIRALRDGGVGGYGAKLLIGDSEASLSNANITEGFFIRTTATNKIELLSGAGIQLTATNDVTIAGTSSLNIAGGGLSVAGNITFGGSLTGSGANLTALNAGSISSGLLSIANGGTNSTATPTAGGVVYGDGLKYTFTASGTAGQCLKSGGVGAPVWETCEVAPGSVWRNTLSSTSNVIGLAYGNGTFVAVKNSGTGNRVATSADGYSWTSRSTPVDNAWFAVTYGNGLFVAVAGSGAGNRVMTSPDGINWTIRNSAADSSWFAVTYGNGLFVAVGSGGASTAVMTSPDGINWTQQTSFSKIWNSVVYGKGKFVAIARNGGTGSVMTSSDGITWAAANAPADDWYSVAYGNGLFVAVAQSGSNGRVMTSSDGVTWTSRQAADSRAWRAITYAEGMFVAASATSSSTNNVMTSRDGINWTLSTTPGISSDTIAYGNGIFLVPGMVSGSFTRRDAPHGNIYLGGITVHGGLVSSGGLKIGEGALLKALLSSAATWDPASINAMEASSTTLPVPGAAMGDVVSVGFDQELPDGVLISGSVSSAGNVRVTIMNASGAPVDLPSGTVRAQVTQF